MLQRHRKYASTAVLLALLLSLTGCPDDGGGGASPDGGSGGGGGNVPSVPSTPTTEPSPPPRTVPPPPPTVPAPPPTVVTLPEPEPDTAWHNAEGCPTRWPISLRYPKYGQFYEGLAICYSGQGAVEQNSVLSNHGDKVWAFNPASLGPFTVLTDEAQYFRSAFLSNTAQRWYLTPGEIAQPSVWNYHWVPDLHKTSAWTAYKLAADRVKVMDVTIHKQLLKRQLPRTYALFSCAESAQGAVKSVAELEDSSSALRKFSASLETTSAGASCFSAVKELDDAYPGPAQKVPSWTTYVEHTSGY